MGQKVNPYGIRIGINKTWKSKWYAAPKDYSDYLHEDLLIRKFVEKNAITKSADIANIDIIRRPQVISVILHTSRPGVVIGAKGVNIEKLISMIQKEIGKKVQLKIKEIKRVESNANAIAINIAKQLKNRAGFRRTLKIAISSVMKSGAQGVKVRISGRLGGAEMARVVTMKEGRVPLHTLRADIDYGFYIAHTTFGSIGIKVWIFNGEIFKKDKKERFLVGKIKNNEVVL